MAPDSLLPWWAPSPMHALVGLGVCVVLCVLGGVCGWLLRTHKAAAGLAALGLAGLGLWNLFQALTWGAVVGAIFRDYVPLPVGPEHAITVVSLLYELPIGLLHLCLVAAAFLGRSQGGRS